MNASRQLTASEATKLIKLLRRLADMAERMADSEPMLREFAAEARQMTSKVKTANPETVAEIGAMTRKLEAVWFP